MQKSCLLRQLFVSLSIVSQTSKRILKLSVGHVASTLLMDTEDAFALLSCAYIAHASLSR